MRKMIPLVAVIFAFGATGHAEEFTFDFTVPTDPARLQSTSLWSTQYLVHAAAAQPPGETTIELRRRDGAGTGVMLKREDWCRAVMEGTVAVKSESTIRTFNVDGLQDEPQTDCGYLFRNTEPSVLRRLSRQVFAEIAGARAFGLGVNGYRLVPFRTVAADPNQLPSGTVLYIAGLRGRTLQLPDGSTAKHDGYVFVADRGGSIIGNHVDFFTGISTRNPAPDIVTSDKRKVFKALIVTDSAVISALKELHLKR